MPDELLARGVIVVTAERQAQLDEMDRLATRLGLPTYRALAQAAFEHTQTPSPHTLQRMRAIIPKVFHETAD